MATNKHLFCSRRAHGFTARMSRVLLAVCVLGIAGALLVARAEAASASAYAVSMEVPHDCLWLSDGNYQALHSPTTTEVIVRVRDAQGQPVDGVLVTFEIDPTWVENATVVPRHTVIRNGVAQALFRANQTGAVRVTARVGNTTKAAYVTVVKDAFYAAVSSVP